MRLSESQPRVGRRLGLALGGGGARGLAHVGVLRAVLEAGISIDFIAGISMGAIVATAFALKDDFLGQHVGGMVDGLRLTPGKSWARRPGPASWWASLRRLVDTAWFVADNLVWWGVAEDAIVETALAKVTAGRRLEEGRIPLAVVACDLMSGAPVVFRAGPAALALRASTALPGFVRPVSHNGQLLADGGFVGMVPTAVVREMGADVVIAVDVDPPCAVAEVRNGLDALLRALEICSQGHKEALLREADLVIRPEFGEPIGTLDFSRSAWCVEAGVRAGREAVPAIRALLGAATGEASRVAPRLAGRTTPRQTEGRTRCL
jgi:NTE family protein